MAPPRPAAAALADARAGARWSELMVRFAHASLSVVAEPPEGWPEQGGEEPSRAFEGELRCVGHLGSGPEAAEGHVVSTAVTVLFSPRSRMRSPGTNSRTV